MPKLADNLTRSVFYLYALDGKTGSPAALGGTGFFVARQSVALPYTWHVFAVSNVHVAIRAAASILRVNTRDGASRFIPYEPTDWVQSATDDLAIIDVTDQLGFSIETGLWTDDISWVDEIHFVPEPFRSPYGIGIGDNTIMLGMFANHSEGSRNAPIGRFGNVAALPDEANPARLHKNDRFARPSYLNDMRSRTGFSGSPVWVWRTPQDDMNSHKQAQGILPRLSATERSFLALIGVHRGQFSDKVPICVTGTGASHAAEIPSSMTVVVPAWEITKLMNHKELMRNMTERDTRPERIEFSERICTVMRAQEARLLNR